MSTKFWPWSVYFYQCLDRLHMAPICKDQTETMRRAWYSTRQRICCTAVYASAVDDTWAYALMLSLSEQHSGSERKDTLGHLSQPGQGSSACKRAAFTHRYGCRSHVFLLLLFGRLFFFFTIRNKAPQMLTSGKMDYIFSLSMLFSSDFIVTQPNWVLELPWVHISNNKNGNAGLLPSYSNNTLQIYSYNL